FADLKDGVRAMVEGCFESVCDTCIIPMQDILGLGGESRMNLPGTVGGNWMWRMKPGAFTQEIMEWLHDLNLKTGRIAGND
ncbi:MAG: 4-alpha-glucanotransferase, partial [Clostridiales bacterium]|nr:4-alpha-glucanotransferase [Clostridiales bacterium]